MPLFWCALTARDYMGSGQVWLNDPNYMTDAEPQLQIIAISGIVDR